MAEIALGNDIPLDTRPGTSTASTTNSPSGPAVAELLRQFVVHNRMMAGGGAIDGTLITLAEITCPILAFIGEVDDIGQPSAVRGIRRAAPRAEVSELVMRAGHFGLVVGSTAATQTWPNVGKWVLWQEGRGPRPQDVLAMEADPHVGIDDAAGLSSRIAHSAGALAEVLGRPKCEDE